MHRERRVGVGRNSRLRDLMLIRQMSAPLAGVTGEQNDAA
jgi:hypothetical protein